MIQLPPATFRHLSCIDHTAEAQARTQAHWAAERAKLDAEIRALTEPGRIAEAWFKNELAALRKRNH